MRLLALAALVPMLAIAAPTGSADHSCPNYTIVDVGGLVYVGQESYVNEHGYIISVWSDVAIERNGQAGLQDDEWVLRNCPPLTGDQDPCQSNPTPDTCIL